jgi:hypothetical protein
MPDYKNRIKRLKEAHTWLHQLRMKPLKK